MKRIFDKTTHHKQNRNADMPALFVGICCLIMILGNTLFPNEVNAWNRGDKVVVQNQAGLRVREDARISNDNIVTLLPNGAKGTIVNGPKAGLNNSLTWYEVSWEAPVKVRGYSAESQNGCVYLITPERAIQKDRLVEELFGLDEGTANAKTYHDYNGYGCDPNNNNACDGYRGGHSGWDVQTKSVAGNATADEAFYSLTDGEVISVGGPFGRIAVYNEVSGPKTVIYLHARQIYVKEGDFVDVGDPLGIQGDISRNDIGEHVHIEVKNGYHTTSACGASTAIDPIPYLYERMSLSRPRPPIENDPENGGETGTVTENEADTIIRIAPASVESPRVNQELALSLEIEDGEDVFGYQATIAFDKTALRYVSSANGDYLSGNPFFQATLEGNTITLASTAFVGESNGDGTLATLLFEVVSVKDSAITITEILLSDIGGKSFIPNVKSAEVTAPERNKVDVNGDGTINIQDLVLVASNFGRTGKNDADVNNDGVVNIQDLVLVAASFGAGNAAPSPYPNLQEMPTTSDVQLWLSQARQLALTDATSRKGIFFLEQLLAALTPKQTMLLPNYPNPFNPETWIPYQLAESTNVSISIHAADGALVQKLVLGHHPVGLYESRSRAAYWDGKNALGEPVASGVYFYTLTAGDFSATRKMLIRK